MKTTFIDSGREPQCPSNPDYPDGMDVDVSGAAARTCTANIPYPSPRCGLVTVECEMCGVKIALTVAGRKDDPKSVKIGCKLPTRLN